MQKKFSLLGDVQDVGLRIGLVNDGMSNNVKAYPHNSSTNKNHVDVTVVGSEKDIQKFYNDVKKDLRINKKGNNYSVTPLEDYKEKVPDWTWVTIKIIIEQLKKGVFEYFEIKTLLEKLVKKKRNRRKSH
jgi:acylphosphatase